MHLLNTTSFKLKYFHDSKECKYAILSHTWDIEEVTFNDIADLHHAKAMLGFAKIRWTCQLARDRGLQYAWVDTCCIDKSSSAELTEAINSMFRWYKDAAICFVYLADLPSFDDNEQVMDESLSKCRWFTRGWTLQELIASSHIEFYDCDWTWKGTKLSLQRQLSEITGVSIEVLENCDNLSIIPVGRRMSWASRRQTTREEDLAYCLFGIFDVNLPLIYGEGPKAFLRLQEAIIHENADLSLFAWTPADDLPFVGILARKPSEFRACGNLEKASTLGPYHLKTPFAITNTGLRIEKYVKMGEKEYFLELDCIDSSKPRAEDKNQVLAIRLAKNSFEYVRFGSGPPVVIEHDRNASTKDEGFPLIPKTISSVESRLIKSRLAHGFAVSITDTAVLCSEFDYELKHNWDIANRCFITNGHKSFLESFAVRPRRITFQNTSVADYCTFKPCVVVFGLEERYNMAESDKDDGNNHLNPWATLFPSDTADLEFYSADPHLNKQYLSSVSRQNGSTTLMLTGFITGNQNGARTRFPSVALSKVQISVSAKIDQTSCFTMYKLELNIEKTS
jgi:hypothetical protein